MNWGIVQTIVGPIRFGHLGRSVSRIQFSGASGAADGLSCDRSSATQYVTPETEMIAQAIESYFSGQWDALEGWPLRIEGTVFRNEVWATLRRIPFGQSITYSGLAALAGHPGAARAIGSAMAANPVPLFVPCHRVLAAGGRLGGFSPDLEIKRILLRHEGIALGPRQTSLFSERTMNSDPSDKIVPR